MQTTITSTATEALAIELERGLARVWAQVLRSSFRELSRTATSVLGLLRDTGPRRVTDLAATEAVAQPTMTALVGRLERLGLVARRPGPPTPAATRATPAPCSSRSPTPAGRRGPVRAPHARRRSARACRPSTP